MTYIFVPFGLMIYMVGLVVFMTYIFGLFGLMIDMTSRIDDIQVWPVRLIYIS